MVSSRMGVVRDSSTSLSPPLASVESHLSPLWTLLNLGNDTGVPKFSSFGAEAWSFSRTLLFEYGFTVRIGEGERTESDPGVVSNRGGGV